MFLARLTLKWQRIYQLRSRSPGLCILSLIGSLPESGRAEQDGNEAVHCVQSCIALHSLIAEFTPRSNFCEIYF